LVAAAGGRVRRTNLVLKDAGLPKAFWRHHAQLDLLGRLQRNRQIFVAAVAHRAFGEDSMPRDPVDGLSVGFLGVGLEDEPFAGAPGGGCPSAGGSARGTRFFSNAFRGRGAGRVRAAPSLMCAICHHLR
jgi:hypothetical protein